MRIAKLVIDRELAEALKFESVTPNEEDKGAIDSTSTARHSRK
jgi:hypothetical protein